VLGKSIADRFGRFPGVGIDVAALSFSGDWEESKIRKIWSCGMKNMRVKVEDHGDRTNVLNYD
jgi:hypothetical protein